MCEWQIFTEDYHKALLDLAAARARIAELEDWQRRAVANLTYPVGCDCPKCSRLRILLSEAKP